MAAKSSFTDGLQATAIITGSMLSGSMMTITLLSIPVWLDTITQPTYLLSQWIRMFHYGHRGHPSMAVLTLALYTLCAWQRRSEGKRWRTLLTAGIVTILMSAFTLLFMIPTNTILFEYASASGGIEVVELKEVRQLVLKWGWMHLTRSFFPLIGAVIGMGDMKGDWVIRGS
ncbi:hypothetical protein BDW72DRAFT_204626 [Aspergillus terricola var. indicus]